MGTLDKVVEFGALFVIGILVLAFFERAMAVNAQAQANLAQQRTLTNLEGQAGQDILGLFF